jgi:hypothetical protein
MATCPETREHNSTCDKLCKKELAQVPIAVPVPVLYYL